MDHPVKEWLLKDIVNGDIPIAYIVLNQAFGKCVKQFIQERWKSATFRVAVDGGASQLKQITESPLDLIPDLICGDFDSITSETLDYYEKKGVQIVATPNQDQTDFTKALELTLDHLQKHKKQVGAIIAVAQNSGRLDHILGNLNTLFLSDKLTSIPVIILSENSLTWLLSPGSHRVHICDEMRDGNMGLLPLGEPCDDVCTTGLKWNLSHDKMQFGGLVSTSNQFEDCDTVTVETDNYLIWTTEIALDRILAM